jgi:threonine dehydrogenase-like Zn-dependent dehydrogenase
MCGSDLHIYNGVIPEMERGDVIGHETMAEVVEVGRKNTKLKVGDPDADTDAPRPNGADDPMPSALRH